MTGGPVVYYSGTGSLQKHDYDQPPILNTAFRSKMSVPIKRQEPLQRRPSEQRQRESLPNGKSVEESCISDLPSRPLRPDSVNHPAQTGKLNRRSGSMDGTKKLPAGPKAEAVEASTKDSNRAAPSTHHQSPPLPLPQSLPRTSLDGANRLIPEKKELNVLPPRSNHPTLNHRHSSPPQTIPLPRPQMSASDSEMSGPPSGSERPSIVSTATTPRSSPPQSIPEGAERPTSANSSFTATRSSPLRTTSFSIKSLFRRNSTTREESWGDLSLCTSPKELAPTATPTTKIPVSSTSLNSPTTSQSNSAQSSSAPSDRGGQSMVAGLRNASPPRDPPKPFRSSTGLSLREKIKFNATPRPQRPVRWIRSPSLDDIQNQPDRPGISIPADSGVGLKSRRMSASLPHDFHVDTCDLSEEFVSASRLPGRRGKEIGKGATATVKIMCRRGSPKDTHYAVKEFRKRGRNECEKEYEQKVKSEFSIANSLNHPNIVKTVRLCSSTGRWNHVMEYCCHGDLFSLVQRNSLQREDQMCLFKQLLHGVAYLHEKGIAHRDIKLENLLLSYEGHLKITDFGVSEVFSGIHPGLRSAGGACGKEMGEIRKCSPGICGSLPYISPEVLAKDGDYDPRPLDVWSSAIVCLALCFRGTPWQSAKPDDPNYAKFHAAWNEFLKKKPDGYITETEYPSCGRLFSALHKEALRRLLLRMLHPNPEKRATMQEVLTDRWMKTIECCCPEPEDLERCVTCIDAAGKGSGKLAAKMIVQKKHHHIPADKRRRFDMDET